MDFFDIWLVCLGVFLVFYITIIILYYKNSKSKIVLSKQAATFNSGTRTLILKKQCSDLANVISVVDDQDYTMAYEPVTLHVGSASVGGVTTGGAYTTGGYNYIANTKKNGYAYLQYKPSVDATADFYSIDKISLPTELYEKAKKSYISKYLGQDSTIMVRDEYSSSEIENKMFLSEMQQFGYSNNHNLMNRGKPSRQKCEEILSWICDDGKSNVGANILTYKNMRAFGWILFLGGLIVMAYGCTLQGEICVLTAFGGIVLTFLGFTTLRNI